MSFPTCTLEGLTARLPCFQCLSDDRIQAIRTLLMTQIAEGRSANTDPATLRQSADCLICLSDRDLMIAETIMLCEVAAERGDRVDCNIDDLIEESKCLQCLPAHDLRAIFEAKLCAWLATLAVAPEA